MEDIKRCTRCVLPTTLPSVEFDSDGVCNQCRRYDKLFGNWENRRAQREKGLEALFKRARRMNRRYDCLVGLSGGKDSTYVLYLCDRIYKLRCLCVTFDNGFMSQHARSNISNALRATNADHIFYTVNRKLLLKLYRLLLSKTGDFCSVCMRGISVCMWDMAIELGIPLVISGAGKRVAYLSSIPELFQGGDVTFLRNVLQGEQIEKDALALQWTRVRGLLI